MTASKQLDATKPMQGVGAIALLILTGGLSPPPRMDHTQKIRVCLVVARAQGRLDASVARITIQRIVWDTQGQITLVSAVTDPALYAAFFAKLE